MFTSSTSSVRISACSHLLTCRLFFLPYAYFQIVSKPTQRKCHPGSDQSREQQIMSGSLVALFNRPQPNPLTTRYLVLKDGAFVPSATDWGVFRIQLCK